MPRISRKNTAAAIAAPGPTYRRAATSGMPAAATIISGANTMRNWAMPKSNSPWNTDRPISRAPNATETRIVLSHVGRALPFCAMATSASRCSRMMPAVESPAPPISIRCVGPQSVTSWPKRRCQTSSSGKPMSAYRPQAAMKMPLTGAYQVRVILTAATPGFSPSRGKTTADMPAMKSAKSP